jgi:hypothetical protein
MIYKLQRLFTVEYFFKNIACRITYTVQYEVHKTGNDLTLNQNADWNFSTQHSTVAICARTHQTSRTGQTELQSTTVATTITNIHEYQSNAAFLSTITCLSNTLLQSFCIQPYTTMPASIQLLIGKVSFFFELLRNTVA